MHKFWWGFKSLAIANIFLRFLKPSEGNFMGNNLLKTLSIAMKNFLYEKEIVSTACWLILEVILFAAHDLRKVLKACVWIDAKYNFVDASYETFPNLLLLTFLSFIHFSLVTRRNGNSNDEPHHPLLIKSEFSFRWSVWLHEPFFTEHNYHLGPKI